VGELKNGVIKAGNGEQAMVLFDN